MPGMPTIQPIEHDGHVVALVAGERAIVSDELQAADRRLIHAKCFYALQIQAGERPGPYTDLDATRYARRATRRPARRRALAGSGRCSGVPSVAGVFLGVGINTLWDVTLDVTDGEVGSLGGAAYEI
jgi:hypothetical protein